MNKADVKNFMFKLSKKMAVGALPPPISAVIETILECNSDNELEASFAKINEDIANSHIEMENYVNNELRKIPPVLYSAEIEDVSVIVMYLLYPIDEQDKKAIEELLWSGELNDSGDSFVEENTIVVNMSVETDKEEAEYDIVKPVTEFVKELGLSVKAVVYL